MDGQWQETVDNTQSSGTSSCIVSRGNHEVISVFGICSITMFVNAKAFFISQPCQSHSCCEHLWILLREMRYVQVDWGPPFWPLEKQLICRATARIYISWMSCQKNRSLFVWLCFQTCIRHRCAALAWDEECLADSPKTSSSNCNPDSTTHSSNV